MSTDGRIVSVRVDPANPGQFFACCGLLELADRLWSGAEGWFEGTPYTFRLRPLVDSLIDPSDLFAKITGLKLKNEMSASQLERRKELGLLKKQSTDPAERETLELEKKELDALWREAPIWICEPIELRLDWFLDTRGGGNVFKTWGGQQSIADIAFSLHGLLTNFVTSKPSEWLLISHGGDCLPFNFDCDLAVAGSDIDLGFSLDPLRQSCAAITCLIRPVLEFLAFVGLERFRPRELDDSLPRRQRQYVYSLWNKPATPELAAFFASSVALSPESHSFQFRLLYRTEYLKSFLPATKIGGLTYE